MSINNQTLLFDLGSFYSHVGNSFDDQPIFNFFSWTLSQSNALILDQKENYQIRENNLSLEESFQYVLQKSDYKESNQNSIAIAYSDIHNFRNKQLMLEILFEQFNVENVLFCHEAVLDLISFGLLSGTVCHMSHSKTQTFCFKDSFSVQGTYLKQSFGGKDLAQKLQQFINVDEIQLDFIKRDYFRFSRVQVREEDIYQQKNEEEARWQYEIKPDQRNIKYFDKIILPDGAEVEPSAYLTQIPEQIFSSQNNMSVQEQIYQSVFQCQNLDRKRVCQNIILSGGNSKIYDLAFKIRQIMDQFLPNSFSYNLHLKNDSLSDPLRGLYVLSNCQQVRNNFINKEEYREQGQSILLQKAI